jgi:hypothetical protein
MAGSRSGACGGTSSISSESDLTAMVAIIAPNHPPFVALKQALKSRFD